MLVSAPLNTQCQVCLCHRDLYGNGLMGPIPSEISALTELRKLYAPSLIEVIESWSCVLLSVGHARLSLSFQEVCFINLQGDTWQQTEWDNSCSNVCVGQAEMPVSPHFFFNESWSKLLAFSFDGCWSCAPRPHIFKFFFATGNSTTMP